MTPSDIVIAVDPGEKRTGIAVAWPERVTCTTHGPWEAVAEVEALIEETNEWQLAAVVAERWVPYGGGSNNFRELIEAKCLGAIQWMCKQHGVVYVEQPTSLLKPTQAIADSRGYVWKSKDRDQHSAETHLYHYLHLGEEPT